MACIRGLCSVFWGPSWVLAGALLGSLVLVFAGFAPVLVRLLWLFGVGIVCVVFSGLSAYGAASCLLLWCGMFVVSGLFSGSFSLVVGVFCMDLCCFPSRGYVDCGMLCFWWCFVAMGSSWPLNVVVVLASAPFFCGLVVLL